VTLSCHAPCLCCPQRAAVLGNKMQREVQSGVAAFLKENPKLNELVNARGEIRLEVCVDAGKKG
jgi:hypothetical protein